MWSNGNSICNKTLIYSTIHYNWCGERSVIDDGVAGSTLYWTTYVSYSTVVQNNCNLFTFSYHLSAGINNSNEHFTTIIKTKKTTYYYFNDMHRLGCTRHDGHLFVELAVYALKLWKTFIVNRTNKDEFLSSELS